MPKKPFKYFGDLQGYEFLKGVITDDPDSETDTCTVEVFLPSEQSLKTIESVPIFYHCDETVEERENGALEGSSAAFAKDDEVIILKQRDGLDDKIFVIGRIDGAQHCCWIEPWDGPELTTLWPWEHIYGGENQYPGTPIFADNSTAEIEDGILSLNVGQTPTGGHWLEQWHQWYYYPASPIRLKAGKVYFDADARQWCGFPDKNSGYCLLAIVGEKDSVPIYFQVYVYNSSYLWGSKIPIGCTNPSGWPPDAETEWEEVSSNTWAKNILFDTQVLIDLPITGVQVNYVLLEIRSWVEAAPPPSYLSGFSMAVNEIRIC